MKLRQSFTDFIFATNTDGSGKAASYVRALDILGPILTKHYPNPIIGGSMWHGFSLPDIHTLHEVRSSSQLDCQTDILVTIDISRSCRESLIDCKTKGDFYV